MKEVAISCNSLQFYHAVSRDQPDCQGDILGKRCSVCCHKGKTSRLCHIEWDLLGLVSMLTIQGLLAEDHYPERKGLDSTKDGFLGLSVTFPCSLSWGIHRSLSIYRSLLFFGIIMYQIMRGEFRAPNLVKDQSLTLFHPFVPTFPPSLSLSHPWAV